MSFDETNKGFLYSVSHFMETSKHYSLADFVNVSSRYVVKLTLFKFASFFFMHSNFLLKNFWHLCSFMISCWLSFFLVNHLHFSKNKTYVVRKNCCVFCKKLLCHSQALLIIVPAVDSERVDSQLSSESYMSSHWHVCCFLAQDEVMSCTSWEWPYHMMWSMPDWLQCLTLPAGKSLYLEIIIVYQISHHLYIPFNLHIFLQSFLHDIDLYVHNINQEDAYTRSADLKKSLLQKSCTSLQQPIMQQ